MKSPLFRPRLELVGKVVVRDVLAGLAGVAEAEVRPRLVLGVAGEPLPEVLHRGLVLILVEVLGERFFLVVELVLQERARRFRAALLDGPLQAQLAHRLLVPRLLAPDGLPRPLPRPRVGHVSLGRLVVRSVVDVVPLAVVDARRRLRVRIHGDGLRRAARRRAVVRRNVRRHLERRKVRVRLAPFLARPHGLVGEVLAEAPPVIVVAKGRRRHAQRRRSRLLRLPLLLPLWRRRGRHRRRGQSLTTAPAAQLPQAQPHQVLPCGFFRHLNF